MWSGTLPTEEDIVKHPQTLKIYDAIWKRHYMLNYQMSPDVFENTSDITIKIWNEIAKKEHEKQQQTGNGE